MNMIYYSIDKDGLLSGWHPAFNYDTKENLEASMKLPLPTNRQASMFAAEIVAGKPIDESWQPDNSLDVNDLITLVNVYELLKNGVRIDPTTEKGRELIEKLVELDDTTKYKITPKGVNNFTISRANFVINNPKNYPLLQKPVSMASPQLMGAMSKEGKDAKQRSKEQISSIVQGKIDNMIGRDMIGIVASTGLKSLSALTAVYNKSIMDLSDLNEKMDRLNAVVPRDIADQAEIERRRAELYTDIENIKMGFPKNFSVANVNYENAKSGVLNLIKPRFIINTEQELDIASQYIVQNMMEGLSDDAAEIESELLSAATDNAKELILGKIRAIPEFGTIYTALIAQGVPFWSIVQTMTSPATDFYMKHFDREPFKKVILNFDSALNTVNKIENTISNANGKINSKVVSAIKELKTQYGFSYKNGIITDADNVSISVDKLKSFKNLLTQGKAVQILGKYLGINQGIKAKAFEIYSFTKTIEEYMVDEFGINFNFTKFLNSLNSDKVYANDMIRSTSLKNNGNSGAFNLLYVLSKATNFEKQLQGFNVTNQILRESTYKLNGAYAVTKALESYVIKDAKPLNEDQFNEVQRFIDNSVLLQFFNDETKRNNNPKTRPVFYDGLNRIELTTKQGREQFMTWVHDKFIPMVKNMPDFNDNEFVRDLTYETVRDTLYAEPVEIVRMTYDTTNALTDETRSKEDNYKYHLNQLQFAYDTDPSKPEVNNIFNVLFWYNTLVNKGGTGKYSWAKMQNDLIINSEDHPFKRLAELQGRLGKDTFVSFYVNDGSNKRRISVNGITLDIEDLVTYHNLTGTNVRINETLAEEALRNAESSDGENIDPTEYYDDDSNANEDTFFDEDSDENGTTSQRVSLTKIRRVTRKGEVGTKVVFNGGGLPTKTVIVKESLISIPYDLKVTEETEDRIESADSARALREIGSRFEELNPNIVIKYQTKRQLVNLSNTRLRDFTKTKAFILDGEVNINLDRASVSDVIHEYAHLFLHSLKYESIEMYDNLIQMAVNDPQYTNIANDYPDLVDSDLNEEVFVTIFGKTIKDKIDFDYVNKELILNFADFTKQKLKQILNKDVETVVELSAQEVANLSFEEAIDLMGDTIMKNRIENLFDGPLGFAREIKRLKDDLFNNGLLIEECSG